MNDDSNAAMRCDINSFDHLIPFLRAECLRRVCSSWVQWSCWWSDGVQPKTAISTWARICSVPS